MKNGTLTGSERTLRWMRKKKAAGLCTGCGRNPAPHKGVRKNKLRLPLCQECREAQKRRRRAKHPVRERHGFAPFANFLRLYMADRQALAAILEGRPCDNASAVKRLAARGILTNEGSMLDVKEHWFVCPRCGLAVFVPTRKYHEGKCRAA